MILVKKLFTVKVAFWNPIIFFPPEHISGGGGGGDESPKKV